MYAKHSRARKILLNLQNENPIRNDFNETTNPDTALFLNNQFPKPYDDVTEHYDPLLTASSDAYPQSFALPVTDNNSDEYAVIETMNHDSTSNFISSSILLNIDSFHIVENVTIEETVLGNEVVTETQICSPSLLTQYNPITILNSSSVNTDLNDNITQNDNACNDNISDNSLQDNIAQLRIPIVFTNENIRVEKNLPLETSPSNSTQESASVNHTLEVLMDVGIKKLVDYSDSDSGADEPVIKRKKRCQVKRDEWAGEINKKNREKGKRYLGKKKVDGEWKKNIVKPERVLKPRCSCKEKTKSVIQCHLISDEDRRKLFDKFWDMTWDEKRVYIENLVKVIHTNRQRDRKNPEESKRVNTFIYYLKKGEDTIRVCKTLFLNTFSIGKSCVWEWKTQSQKNTDEQATTSKNTLPVKKPFDKELVEMQNFLNELPKMPSHYCRQRTTQSYLQPDIESKRQLYDLYKIYCKDKNVKPLSIATFSNTLTVQKISIFKPKKDQCVICNGYKLGKTSKDDYDEHVNKKEAARAEKDSDKKEKEFVFTADLQAVLLAPRSNVSSHYYKTKLCVHNWCIYDMKTGDGYCFLWNETEGGLNSDEFATIISKFFIETVIPKMGEDNREIILYSDGCTYQNRNTILTNALVNVAMLHNVTIIQKYLEMGHTQMEVDSMHAMIERKLKHQTINVPAEYINICRKARNSKPYHVKYLNYGYFKNFQNLSFYKSIRPGKMKGDPKVTDIRCLKYDPSGRVYYKLKFCDRYTLLSQRKNNNVDQTPFENLPQMYEHRRKIKKKKYLDLQELKNTMPDDYQNYYVNLPHEE